MKIREITPDDAEAFLDLCRKLDQETPFMLLEPDERTMTLPGQQAELAELNATDNATIFVAEDNETDPGTDRTSLVGYLGVYGGQYRRNQRTAYLVIGIRQRFTGRGIGTRLFQTMETWAREQGIHRLELTVITENQAAIGLYRKQGFSIEGTRSQTLYTAGRYQDEYWMAKLL